MGGEGSGRKPDPMKEIFKKETPIGQFGNKEPITLPNYSGVKTHQETLTKVQSMIDTSIAAITHTVSQPARAFDTIYTNSTSRTILVFGSVSAAPGKAGTWTDYAEFQVGDGATPDTKQGKYGGNQALTDSLFYAFIGIVSPGQTYRLVHTSIASTSSINYWNEILL